MLKLFARPSMDGVARRGHNARGVGVFCREEIHFSQESYLE